MARKLKVVLVLVVFIGTALSISAWAQPSLEVGSVSRARGATVNVPVTFTNSGGVVGLQFDLQSNPAVLGVGTLTNGPVLSPHLRYSANDRGWIVGTDYTRNPFVLIPIK